MGSLLFVELVFLYPFMVLRMIPTHGRSCQCIIFEAKESTVPYKDSLKDICIANMFQMVETTTTQRTDLPTFLCSPV